MIADQGIPIISHAIQLAIAPVFLLTGIAGLLGVMANRLARVIDRAPPGAPNWHLPPPETKMVFIGLTPRQLCETIKNPRMTGGKDLSAMYAHMRDDKLVAWGWNPGGNRAPAPATQAQTAAAFKTWMDAGSPCPTQ